MSRNIPQLLGVAVMSILVTVSVMRMSSPGSGGEVVMIPNTPQATPPMAAPPRRARASCPWQFQTYTPSPFETDYYKRSDAELKYPCKLLKQHFPKENDEFFKTTSLIHNPPLGSVRCDLQPIQPPESIYSFSVYKNNCTGETKKLYLEPLAGVLRHPGTCHDERKWFLEKGYFLIDGWHTSRGVLPEGAKKLYFDLGASTWNSGLGGASQGWFYSVFKSLCAEFDALFGWEFVVHQPANVFKEIPAELHYKYHWYNIPVNLDFSSPSHPFNMIRTLATPDDFVVLKIDVDTPSVELPLIQYMLAHPDLLALVDEFFFEHHVVMEPLMGLGWGYAPTLVNGTPRDSIDLFTKMRKHGVRAHSWL